MCEIWTQKQWQSAASGPGSKYSIVGTFQNAEGQTAIQVKELGGMFTDLYWNIYSEDGEDANVYLASDDAYRSMEARGFTPVTAGVGFLVETTNPETPATTEPVRVQGKTLAEWAEEGRLNNEREEHVHPTDPEGEPNEEEITAFEASLSADEKEFIELTALVSALGGASIFS